MVYLLLIAGYETTVHLISSGTLTFLQHPEAARITRDERLQQDQALAKSAIEELLRFTTPADIATMRFAREDIGIGGVTIPRAELVLAVLGSANRDASQFPDPDTLDLAREPNDHVAFGQGAHYCLGAALARLEGQIALTTLFRRFPNLRLAEPPESLRWRKGLFFRGLEALPLRL
jgi:cytochrome P450 PksS